MNWNKIKNIYQYLLLRKTRKTRQELRKQRVRYNNNRAMAIDWMRDIAVKLPIMRHGDKYINHYAAINKFYCRFDIAGANYYIEMILRNKDLKEFVKQFKAQPDACV